MTDKNPQPNHSKALNKNRFAKGVDWPVVLFIGTIHVLPLVLCVVFPSWQGVVLLVALYVLTTLGVTIGYHRKLTHHSFKSPAWVDRVLALVGTLAGEGPPIFWVAHHRKHHRFSDLEGDPHSPEDGFWWAHWLWLFPRRNTLKLGILYKKWAPDLVKVGFYRHLEARYFLWLLGSAALIFGAGYLVGGWYMAFSFLAYGFCLRMMFVLHATWMVNSVAHTWGYRNYETSDRSRNNVVVGILAQGEGWHNNHHHQQAASNHGLHRWWEVDLSFYIIFLTGLVSYPLKWIGLGRWRPISHVKFFRRKTGDFVTLCR